MKITGRLEVIVMNACLVACGQLAWVEAAQLGDMPADKILFLGNSITYCPTLYSPPNWWGAVASTRDKDYVHQLTQSIDNATGGSLVLEESPPDPERWFYNDPLPNYVGNTINIADIFERNYNTWDNVRIQNQLDWDADIVVLQFGENLVSGSLEDLETALDTVLTGLKNSSNPHIFVTSYILGANAAVDAIKQKLCAEDPTHRVFVDLGFVDQNPANIGDFSHPNDTGMAVIADTLFDAMKPAPPVVNGPNMIANGDFSTDTSEWSLAGGSSGWSDGTEANPSPNGGSAWLKGLGWFYHPETTPLVADQTYEMSFSAALLSTNGDPQDESLVAHVSDPTGQPYAYITPRLTSDWTDYSFRFTPTADNVGEYTVAFLNSLAGYPEAFGGGGGTDHSCVFGIDNVSLSTVTEILLPGDANGDCVVNDADAAVLASNWLTASGATWGMGDFNADGAVNDVDATILVANWQSGSGSSASVPEPATLMLMGVGVLYMYCLRRQKAC